MTGEKVYNHQIGWRLLFVVYTVSLRKNTTQPLTRIISLSCTDKNAISHKNYIFQQQAEVDNAASMCNPCQSKQLSRFYDCTLILCH